MIEGSGSGGPKHVDPVDPDPGFGTGSARLVTRQEKHHLPGMHRLDAVHNLGPLNDHH
jgi:hypothetical protein